MRSFWPRCRFAFIAGAILTTLSAIARATELPPVENAMGTVRNYSAAFMRLDTAEVVKLTHPALILRVGGEDRFKDGMQQMFRSFESLGLKEGTEQLGSPSEPFIDGQTMMVGIPAIRKASGIATTPFVYVATSYDGGKSWKVLDLACTDENWLRGLAPTYKGEPDILGRRNPAVIALHQNKALDERTFLLGPRWDKK